MPFPSFLTSTNDPTSAPHSFKISSGIETRLPERIFCLAVSERSFRSSGRGQACEVILLKKSFPKNDDRILRSQMPNIRFSRLG